MLQKPLLPHPELDDDYSPRDDHDGCDGHDDGDVHADSARDLTESSLLIVREGATHVVAPVQY